MGGRLTAVVDVRPGQSGKLYRSATNSDEETFNKALEQLRRCSPINDLSPVPNEPMTPDRPSPNSRGLSAVVRYGFDEFGKLFNPRQALALTTFVESIHEALDLLKAEAEEDYVRAVASYLCWAHDRLVDKAANICVWNPPGEKLEHVFGRQALAMVWDYGEVNPFSGMMGDWLSALEWVYRSLVATCDSMRVAVVQWGSATRLPMADASFQAVVTDPPYYDSVPYSDLSDFFYVWLKRSVGRYHPDLFRTPLTPKREELIAYFGTGVRQIQKPPEWYEENMSKAFEKAFRILAENGIASVMFAHRTTSAWESIISGLIRAGLVESASWPIHTERAARMLSQTSAALASSVTLVCRKRTENVGDGFWDEVRQELKEVVQERLDFFWDQGIRGADFFISAIGPALSVFGKYERVTKLSGEEATVGQFLDEVRSLVTNYALTKILKTTHTATIDPESRLYVVWKCSYADAKVPADESFKMAQALGINTEDMWNRTGVLDKSGQNVQAVPVGKRMKVKSLGETVADDTSASLIDVLHRMCVFREKGDNAGMREFLGRSGQARNEALWLVAQALSEILPDGEKEKQLMQGLLNQREALEATTSQRTLF